MVMGRIIVFEEKHGNRYFDASTDEQLARACVKILKERANMWYYREYDKGVDAKFSKQELETLALTDEEVAALPELLRADVEQKISRLKRKKAAYVRNKAEEDKWFNNLELIITLPEDEAAKLTETSPSGRERSVAYDLIQSRGDGEYEGYSIENLE